MSVLLTSVESENVAFSGLKNIESDSKTDASFCIICAKCTDLNSNKKMNDRGILFGICCKVLRIELTDELNILWNKSKRLVICENCEGLLKSFMALYDQFMDIKISLSKMENNAKMQIINSQAIFQLSGGVCAENDVLLFRRLTDQAFKDFNPTLQLPKIDSIIPHNPEKRKSKGRKCKIQRNRVRRVEVLPKDDVIKEEKIEISENFNESDLYNDLDISSHVGIDGDEVISKTERQDLDFDLDSQQFGFDDFSLDSDHNSFEKVEDTKNSKSSSEKDKPKKRRRRTKITCPIAAREARNARRRKTNPMHERLPPPSLDGNYTYRSTKYNFDAEANLYKCGSCNIQRKDHPEMRTHISNLHPVEGCGRWAYKGVKYSLEKETGRIKCEACSKTFRSRASIMKHIRGWHNEQGKILASSGKEYKAKNCRNPPVQLEDGKWLYKGVEYTHDKSTGDYICGLCGRVRKRKGSIMLHIMESHDDNGKKENQCELCSQQFDTKYRLKIHMDIHIPKSHQCEQCGQVFQQSSNMFRHIARIHKQIRPFICEVCGKSFFSRKDCRVHLRTHTKEKPYTCQVPNCGMSFSLMASKQKHEHAVHSNTSDNNSTIISNNLESM